MGARIRWFEPDAVYSVSCRTVDRTFVFAPNHRIDNPLLLRDCPKGALSTDNKIVPVPSIINIIGSSIGRALRDNPLDIHCLGGNVSHFHIVFSADENRLGNIPKFFQQANSLIARNINSFLKREDALFTRARITKCDTALDAEKHLLYAITNPVKDGLVAKTKESPFLSTFLHQTQGESLRFWYIAWASYWKAGGPENKKHHPKDYLKWVEWKTTPLPHLADLTEHQRQTRLRKLVREEEENQERIRESKNQTVMGVPALFDADPRDRPKNPKKSTKQPLCHASSNAAIKAFEQRWKAFLRAHRAASIDYRNGDWTREFPPGSFRPPLIRIINGDGT